MKRSAKIFSLLLLVSITVMSCSGNKGEDGGPKVIYSDNGKGLDNYKALDMRPYQIGALVYLPSIGTSVGTASDPVVEHNLGDYRWNISLGKQFHLTIEDWGDVNAFNDKINQLKQQAQDIYTVKFIQKTDSFAFYQKILKSDGLAGTDNVGTKHSSYHVLAMHTIDGINYLFYTDEEGTTEDVAKLMAKSVLNVEKVSGKPKFAS